MGTINFRLHLPASRIRGWEQNKGGFYVTTAYQPCMHAALYYACAAERQTTTGTNLVNKMSTECNSFVILLAIAYLMRMRAGERVLGAGTIQGQG